MSVLLDARPVAEAIKTALAVPLGGHAYDIATVPGGNRAAGILPTLFAVVHVERRFEESSRRFGAPPGTTSWRIVVTCVGTTINEAAWVAGKSSAALEDVEIPVGDLSLRCRFESSQEPTWDDGRFVGSVSFTCAT